MLEERTRPEALQEIVHKLESIRDRAQRSDAHYSWEIASQLVLLVQMLLHDASDIVRTPGAGRG